MSQYLHQFYRHDSVIIQRNSSMLFASTDLLFQVRAWGTDLLGPFFKKDEFITDVESNSKLSSAKGILNEWIKETQM